MVAYISREIIDSAISDIYRRLDDRLLPLCRMIRDLVVHMLSLINK